MKTIYLDKRQKRDAEMLQRLEKALEKISARAAKVNLPKPTLKATLVMAAEALCAKEGV